MKVLVAGGGGYIGSHCAWYLRRGGHVPLVLDNWNGGRADRVAGLDVVTADADDRARARAAFEHFKFDALVFAVAPHPMPRPARALPEHLCPALLGSGVVLSELCTRFEVGRVVLLSTGHVYGETPPQGAEESAPVRPVCLEGEASVCLEGIFGCYASRGSFSLTTLRLFRVAGAEPERDNGEEHLPERHAIPQCLYALLNGRRFTLWGPSLPTPDGTAVRDFVHVLDVAEAVRLSLEQPSPPPAAVYNVCTGRGTSVREVMAEAERVANRTLIVEPGGAGGEPAAWRVGRRDTIHDALGWEPRHSTLAEIVGSQWEFLLARSRTRQDARENGTAGSGSAELIGEVAVKLGFVRPEDVTRALAIQEEDARAGRPRRLLGLVMLEAGIISNAQLIEILRYYDTDSTGGGR
jgi:UDP-glucose 4-epimerase